MLAKALFYTRKKKTSKSSEIPSIQFSSHRILYSDSRSVKQMLGLSAVRGRFVHCEAQPSEPRELKLIQMKFEIRK